MRVLAIGDVHGCLTALRALLGLVSPAEGDVLVTLGDYVDRGPDSRGVLDSLIGLFDAGRLVPLRGNHDEMMLDALDGRGRGTWLKFGGVETLASYGHQPYDERLACVPPRHRRFLERDCRDYFETATHLFVHGNVEEAVPMERQDVALMRWQKLAGPVRHVSGKTMVCGHTRQKSGEPLAYEKAVCIDTGAYEAEGWLTCLDVGTGRYWQANERGQTREGALKGGRAFESGF